MGASVIDAVVRGQRGAWIALFAVVLVAVVVALAQRPGRTSVARVLVLAGLTTALSALGILVAMGLSIPKIVWRDVPLPPFATSSGATWRGLRAPAAAVLDNGRPEIGIPGLDASGAVRLFGLFSGKPIEGLAEAPEAAPSSGRARICRVDREECRAWPKEWPEPTAAPTISDFVWSRELFVGALAYDVESGRFLHHVDGLREAGAPLGASGSVASLGPARGSTFGDAPRVSSGAWALEQVGRFTAEPSKDGETALFVVRRIANGRLDAARVIATPSGDRSSFTLQRATVSLGAGPAALSSFARPLLLTLVLWFPVVTILFQAAPAWWAARRRKGMAEGRELPPMPADAASFSRHARAEMAGRLHGLSLLCVGLALLAPAAVAIAELVASR